MPSAAPASPTRTLAAPLLLALAVVLAGCADTDGEAEEAAADAVEEADEAVVTGEDAEVEVEGAGDLALVEGSEEAAEDLAAAVEATQVDSARTTLSTAAGTSGSADGVIGDGTVDGGDLRLEMQVRGSLAEAYGSADTEAEVRVVDGVAYLRFPALIATADVEAQWLSTPIDEFGAESDAGQLIARALLADPAHALALLEAPTAVAELDEEFIGDTPTTHYLATVELGAAGEATSPSGGFFSEFAGDGDRLIEVHAYVDDDGLVRRMEARMTQDGADVEFVLDVLEVDVDVDVEAPSADDVITYDEFTAAAS